MLNSEGEVVTDRAEVLNCWSDEFCKLLTPPDASPDILRNLEKVMAKNLVMEMEGHEYNEEVFNQEFSLEEVHSIVSKSKHNKAPGVDSIVYDVLKNNNAMKMLIQMFNVCFHESVVPSVWRKGIINPIPKGGESDPRVPLSYRGISLLSVVSKLYTAAISNRISTYLEKNNKLVNEQNGFRQNRSCLDHIYTMYETCNIRLKKLENTFLTFIDYAKAFDYVNRDFLLHKLLKLGIRGHIYNAIKCIYTEPKSCVVLNGVLSEWFDVGSGVRQGDSLSHILFAIFINDLGEELNELNVGVNVGRHKLNLLMYVDDIVILSPDTNSAQLQLNVLTNWCSRWGMYINAKKSQVLHVRPHQRKKRFRHLALHGTEARVCGCL